jgi:hypothetical protein
MRCISQLGGVGGTGGSSGQINGTQSLNRNLASRSTGALMVPTSQQANLSSTLSSNDSNQNFHNYNQNTSSSAHHIAFMPTLNGDYHASNKTASLKHQASMEKSIIDQQQDPLSVQSLNNFQQNTQKQFRHDNDTSTHGSRTIDSRFSRDKTLNLSDEDNNNGHNDDDDDENENDGEDDNVDDNEDEAEKATAEKFLVPEPSKEENKKKKKPDEKCLCKHDIDTSHIPIQKQQALTNSGQKSRPSDNNDYSVNLFKGVNFKSSPIITGNSQPIYQTINQQQQQQQKLISLPIQQQKTYSKSKILNDDHRHHHHETEQPSATTTTSLVPVVSGSTNPNKIYSRKEVITTYKEETKNTHLEEYHQTTTFFDTPSGSVEYLSTVPQPLSHPHIITNTSLSKSANKNHMQHSPGHQHQVYQEMSKPGMESIYTNGLLSRSTPPTASGTAYSAPPKQLIKSTKVKTTTVTTTTPLKIARSKRQDDKDPNENNEDNDENDNPSDSNSKDDDTDNDNEGKRKNFHNSSSSSSVSSYIKNIKNKKNNKSNEAAAAISANVDEKTLNDLAVPDQADQELADDHTDDDKDQEDDNGDEKEIILSKISVNKKNKTNMENETENTNNKNNKSNNSSPVSIKSIEPKSPTPTNRSKLSNSDDSESVQDRINLTRMKSIDVEDENDDEEIKANEKNDEKEENDCENESKVTTSHKSNTKNKTDNKPKLKPKKKLSQTPVVVTSTSLSVWHEHRPVTEKKNKNKINFANLMSPDHSEDSENEENSSIYIEEHKKFQPKFSAPVSKKSAKKNAFNSGFKFSLSSSISASSLAFLSQLTESSSSSSSTHSLASSITSSLDDFSFMKSSSSSTSLSASLASVQSVLSSSKSRDSTPVPKLDLKKLPKTSKHSSSNNRKNAPSVSFQTIKKYNLETNILRVKHKQDENLHLLKSKSNKKETSKKKKQPTIHLVKAEIDDSSENEVHKSSSSRSSQNSTKKENIKEQEIIKSCPDIHRKFKSLPRSSSKRQADSACKKHAEIRNKMKIYPTTIMSVSQSDFGTVINQVDVKTNLMITSSTMPSPKKDKKIKKTSKKDNITSNITEDKTTRGSVSSLSSMQSKQSDLVCKNEILEEINEPTVEKLNSIESDIDHDDKQKAADVSFKSSDDGDYVLEDSENKAKQVLLKMEKEKNFHKKKVIIKESNDNDDDDDDDNNNENDEDKDEKEDEKASDDKESILSSSNQEQQQQQKNELKDKKRIKLSVKKFSDNI